MWRRAGVCDSGAAMDDAALAAHVRDALGIAAPRRVVRADADVVVLSKLQPGETQTLFAAVEALPELFDAAAVGVEYGRVVAAYRERGEAPLRTTAWREAVESLLDRLGAERGIDAAARRLLAPGLDSVQAVLDAVLWSAPTVDSDAPASAGERAALADVLEADDHDLFRRYYGSVDGRRVESYCPGAPFARRLLAQAFAVCGGPAPVQ